MHFEIFLLDSKSFLIIFYIFNFLLYTSVFFKGIITLKQRDMLLPCFIIMFHQIFIICLIVFLLKVFLIEVLYFLFS